MKKHVLVKRKHRYTQERDILYQGSCNIEKNGDGWRCRYVQESKETSVQIEIITTKTGMEIHSQGETESRLIFERGKRTKGWLKSDYGTIDIDLDTIKYICRDQMITMVYDIYHGDVLSGGYQIIWNIKEES